MKTVIGLIGVLGAIGLGACAGENGEWQTGGAGEGENIGVATQALTAQEDITASAVRQFPASCVIDGKMLIAGGYDASSTTALSSVYLFDPNGDPEWVSKTALPVATGEAEMIAIPGTDQCLFVGGKTTKTSASLATSYIYDLSGNSWTAVSGTALTGARANFALSLCGNGSGNDARIIAIGGKDSSTYRDTVQVFNVGTQTWSALTTLSATRAFPAVAPLIVATNNNDRYRKFIIAGGENGSGKSAVVDLLFTGTDCTSPDLDVASQTLSTARSKAFAFAEGSADTLMVCGGTTATALATDSCEKFAVTTWGATTVTRSAGATMNVARTQSKVLPAQDVPTAYFVLGGRGLEADTVTTGQVWDYQTDKRWEDKAGGTGTPSFPITARYAGAFERLTNGNDGIASAVGVNVSADLVTFLVSTEMAP